MESESARFSPNFRLLVFSSGDKIAIFCASAESEKKQAINNNESAKITDRVNRLE